MSDRLHLAQVDAWADDPKPGWSFWDLSQGKAVVVRGAHCMSLGMLTLHSIEPNGEVNASINCCEPDHAFYVLDGWPADLRKRRGESAVEAA